MSTTPYPSPSAIRSMPVRLIIDLPDFLQVAPLLMVEGNRMAVGRVRRRITGRVQEFIVDRWVLSSSVPSGRERPPMLDWAVLAAVQPSNHGVQSLLAQAQPKRSQLVIAIALNPADHSRLTVAIWHDGQWTFPEEIRMIGPRMLVLAGNNQPMNDLAHSNSNREVALAEKHQGNSLNELDKRATRTYGALRSLYHRLVKMHVIVPGAGGGGQELVRQLVACGVRHVTTIDGDHLGLENLDRMPLALPADVRRAKAVQLARALHRQQPDLLIHAVPHPIHHPDAIKYAHGTRADVLFSFLDSDVGRLATSLLAREMHTVHIDVGTLIEYAGEAGNEQRTMAADIRLFAPGRGCVACVPEMVDLDSVLYHLSAPPNCLERGQRRPWDALRAGSLLHLNSTAAALAIETWFDWLEGRTTTSTWTRLRWDGLTPQIDSAAVGPSPDCRFCSRDR